MNPAGAQQFFGDQARNREVIHSKLHAAFGRLENSGGGHLLFGEEEDCRDPCLVPLSVNPYELRADQYKDKYVRGLGIWQELKDEWDEGQHDGSEI